MQYAIVDAHCDTLLACRTQGRALSVQSSKGHADIPRLLAGGVRAQVFSLFVEPEHRDAAALKRCLQLLELFKDAADDPDVPITMALTAGDIEEAIAANQMCGIISLESLEPACGDPSLIRTLYDMGVRVASLTWNHRNDFADGVGEGPEGGLSRLGREAVKIMNQLGIVLDVSHLNYRGFMELVELSQHPVIASHSNAKGLCDHPRNLSDDQIDLIAAKGGVIGINFCPAFLRSEGRAAVEDIVNHIDYIVQRVGPDYVGFGSDFDGVDSLPEGITGAGSYPKIVEALGLRGYNPGSIQKICGANFLRVFGEVW